MMEAPDLSLLTATAAPEAPRPTDDPGEVAAEVFARLLVREVQRSLPSGSLLGGSDFAPLEALVTDALVEKLGGDTLGMRQVFSSGAGPVPTSPTHAPHGSGAVIEGARVTSTFGMRAHPVHGALQHHDGIDLAAPTGTPIRAARAGTVVEARRDASYGNLVVIDHGGGLQTRYAHCDRLAVQPGQPVQAGQPIATVGQTGLATGPHLHFEVRSHGTAIDPTGWVLQSGSSLPLRSQVPVVPADGGFEDPGS